MIKSRHITTIAAVLLCLALLGCALIVYAAGGTGAKKTPEYEKKLFNGDVASIDIRVDADQWQQFLDNAMNKEYISCDLIVNGEYLSTVGIRAKGNSSLTQIVNSDSERYSIQFKLDYYVKGQTYFGLDTFCINNMMGDPTYMKDYISYQVMKSAGVDTPLLNYADVTVNGEDFGLYVMLERYDKAFLDRVYGTSAGQLYNVKIQMGQRDNFIADETEQNGGNRGVGMFGGGRGGGSLQYNGDDPANYSSIFDNAQFGTASDDQQKKVITAIKNLNEGTDLEKYFDVDEILRYFAAHTVLVNLDSYISNMQQNYYIYERDGKISVLPWDYGLSFGGFQSGSASGVVNFPIDTPVSGVSMEERPLLNKLLEVDEYKERYHEYLNIIVEEYFGSGLFESGVLATAAKIDEYVKNDATAFFTYEQYTEALPEFIKLGKLRAESIRGQLDGTVPSTTEEQNANPSALVDSSSVNFSALGSMGGGGRLGGGGMDRNNSPGGNRTSNDNNAPDTQTDEVPQEGQPGGNGQMPFPQGGNFNGGAFGGFDMNKMREAMGVLGDAPGGELSEEQITQLKELGLSDEEIEQLKGFLQGGMGGFMPSGGRTGGNAGGMPQQQGMTGGTGAPQQGTVAMSGADWALYGVLGALMLGAILFMALYKRRKLHS